MQTRDNWNTFQMVKINSKECTEYNKTHEVTVIRVFWVRTPNFMGACFWKCTELGRSKCYNSVAFLWSVKLSWAEPYESIAVLRWRAIQFGKIMCLIYVDDVCFRRLHSLAKPLKCGTDGRLKCHNMPCWSNSSQTWLSKLLCFRFTKIVQQLIRYRKNMLRFPNILFCAWLRPAMKRSRTAMDATAVRSLTAILIAWIFGASREIISLCSSPMDIQNIRMGQICEMTNLS